MSWSEYRNVYWNSVDQRIWRTSTSAGDVGINYKLVGTMTNAEYDILLEVLFEVFEDKKISISRFKKIFTEMREFFDHIKDVVHKS